MVHPYDINAPKNPTSLSINSDLLKKSRRLKIDLSAALENALIKEVRAAERDKWLKDNQKAINSLNNLIATKGQFSDAYNN
jgi:antitoxin CcdA